MSKTYDFKKVVCSYAGQPLTGFMEGTGIVIERNEDTFSLVVGSDGEFARSRSNNKSGTITLTLMLSSSSNDVLSALATADELGGAGVAPFFLKDLTGTTIVAAASAWIKKPANVEYGNEIVGREWVLEAGEIEMYVGGTLNT